MQPNLRKKLISFSMENWSCPFTWGLNNVFEIRMSSSNRNLDDYKFSGIPLMPFLISITRCYETLENNKDECAARKHLEEAQITLSHLHKDTDMLDIIKALEHIYQATVAFMSQKDGVANGVDGISQRVPDIKDFNKIQLAGLEGCKSFILALYHLLFIEDAIALAKRAVQGNPKNALWHFVLGRCLRKKRRNTKGCQTHPSPLETSSFTSAARLCPHAFYQIYFIQAIHEANFQTRFLPSEKLEFTKMQWNMYKDMTHTCNDQPAILLKIVLGMMRCKTICDYSIVHSILDRVDELSKENCVSYGYRGRAYAFQHQYEKAFEYLKRSADMHNFVADLDFMRCMLETHKPAVDIIIYLVGMRMKYKNDHPDCQLQILMNLGIMYYSINDYTTSAELFSKAIKMSPNSTKLKGHYSFGNIHMRSLYEFLRDQLLPSIDAASQRDPEFADTFLELTSFIEPRNINRSLKTSKGTSNGRSPEWRAKN